MDGRAHYRKAEQFAEKAAEYLGHSPATLLKTYAHLMPADHDRARDVVQAAFARSAEDSLRTGDLG